MKQINRQYLSNQKLYQTLFQIQKEYYGNSKVRKALLRGPKKWFCDLCDMDQTRIAKKLLPLTK